MSTVLPGMLRSTTQVARLSPSSSAEPPVYVEGDADIVEVQRLMARNHIRSLPVVHGVVVWASSTCSSWR
ncbi:MAG: hypothetical protein H0U17_06515 [Actinobacteria bacterium]|nr:hypothetical protein [Actinomycetota bacterium]